MGEEDLCDCCGGSQVRRHDAIVLWVERCLFSGHRRSAGLSRELEKRFVRHVAHCKAKQRESAAGRCQEASSSVSKHAYAVLTSSCCRDVSRSRQMFGSMSCTKFGLPRAFLVSSRCGRGILTENPCPARRLQKGRVPSGMREMNGRITGRVELSTHTGTDCMLVRLCQRGGTMGRLRFQAVYQLLVRRFSSWPFGLGLEVDASYDCSVG